MDSITQAVLGAAVGEAALGRRVGGRAAAWGAVLGTLPDLDVLLDYGGPVANFTFHRTESHALFWLSLAALPIGWVLARLHRDAGAGVGGWTWLAWLALVTHPLLDALTIYGTQLGLPFTNHPYGTGSVFIIDPAFTLPLLAGLLLALCTSRARPFGRRANAIGLAVGVAYLGYGLAAQAHVESYAARALARDGVAYEQLRATPSPFNGVLWRVLATTPRGYCEGFRSLLDGTAPLSYRCFENDRGRLALLGDSWTAARLAWFSRGYYKVEIEDDSRLVVTDLRMGFEPWYVFSFVLADVVDGRVVPRATEEQRGLRAPGSAFGWVWRRIFDPSLPPLEPPGRTAGTPTAGT